MLSHHHHLTSCLPPSHCCPGHHLTGGQVPGWPERCLQLLAPFLIPERHTETARGMRLQKPDTDTIHGVCSNNLFLKETISQTCFTDKCGREHYIANRSVKQTIAHRQKLDLKFIKINFKSSSGVSFLKLCRGSTLTVCLHTNEEYIQQKCPFINTKSTWKCITWISPSSRSLNTHIQ